MNFEDVIDKVVEFLTTMVSPALQAGFEIAVKRSLIIGISQNIFSVFVIIYTTIVFIFTYKVMIRLNEGKKEHEDGDFGMLMLSWLLGVILIVIFFATFENNFRTLVPEWYAVIDIINIVK